MPYRIVDGDLFDPANTVIAHGCNTAGVMGAGVAKTVRAKFPTVYRNYRHACEQGTFSPGDALPIEDNGVLVYNLASQIRPGPDATVELVRAGLAAMFADMATRGIIAVAIPAIGCGIGGLQFDQLLDLLATDVPTWAYVTLIVRPGEFTIPPAMVARP